MNGKDVTPYLEHSKCSIMVTVFVAIITVNILTNGGSLSRVNQYASKVKTSLITFA